MDVTTAALVGLVALALLFDLTNGFHDSANAIAVTHSRILMNCAHGATTIRQDSHSMTPRRDLDDG
jgi:phosphate/sulfate permease